MKEEEAKTKWCPYAQSRVVSFCEMEGAPASVMRVGENKKPNTSCLGSECAAWRWNLNPKDAEEKTLVSQIQHQKEERDFAVKYLPEGYCGLAGKP